MNKNSLQVIRKMGVALLLFLFSLFICTACKSGGSVRVRGLAVEEVPWIKG